MVFKIKGYGYIPDLPDHRDRKFALERAPERLPESIDFRPSCPPVYDQGQLGSCTGNAIAGAIELDLIRQRSTVFTPSRLFIYYNERVIEGTVDSDSGAQIRDGIKSVASQGACEEEIWPYDIARFTDKPSDVAYAQAVKHEALNYQRIDRVANDPEQSLNILKSVLATFSPFVFGFTVYDSFESEEVAKTGVVNMPADGENVVGGHAVLCVGYVDVDKRFICRNSWGPEWGMQGYFTIPYSYLTNTDLSDDFWCIRLMSG
jgi:C1A family cysteine protease